VAVLIGQDVRGAAAADVVLLLACQADGRACAADGAGRGARAGRLSYSSASSPALPKQQLEAMLSKPAMLQPPAWAQAAAPFAPPTPPESASSSVLPSTGASAGFDEDDAHGYVAGG
jgi:hypothetical protein